MHSVWGSHRPCLRVLTRFGGHLTIGDERSPERSPLGQSPVLRIGEEINTVETGTLACLAVVEVDAGAYQVSQHVSPDPNSAAIAASPSAARPWLPCSCRAQTIRRDSPRSTGTLGE